MDELECRYDKRKSFYGKAHVVIKDETIELYSYCTLVLVYYKKDKTYSLPVGTYSNTTLRHIKEFLKQFTELDFSTKKEIEENCIQ